MTTKKISTRATTRKKEPTRTRPPRKKGSRAKERPSARAEQPHAQTLVRRETTWDEARPTALIDPLLNDLPSVTLKDTNEAFFHFSRIDPRLADAWRRDVVVHEGPITLRRVLTPINGATHYAYVDRRLLWYLKRDPSDPLGARWDGYLAAAHDAPPGTTTVRVGSDLMARRAEKLL